MIENVKVLRDMAERVAVTGYDLNAVDDDERTWEFSIHAIQVNLSDARRKMLELADILEDVYGDEETEIG